MKIALIGYGRMGRAIEEVALKRAHQVVLRIDIDNTDQLNPENLKRADVAIEFTGPQSAWSNLIKCLDAGIPVVCGSTGWLEKLKEIEQYCQSRNGTFLCATNFSVGVNIFFEVNKRLADLMKNHDDYEITLREVHHMGKRDAPSGTAITLAEQVMERVSRKKSWVNRGSEKAEDLEIISERKDPVPGIHSVKYSSPIDDIEITHTAHNRQGFALGAILGAEFIYQKKGIFTMKDVLSL
jgi:4-hydroxy-tetrahydrodipicolinate reductase